MCRRMRVDLLVDRGRQIVLASRFGAFDFLRQDGKRRLQPVREIACLRRCPRDPAFAIVEQPIQIVDERCHFVRILAFDPAASPVAHIGEALTEHRERRESSTNHGQTGGDEHRAGHRQQPFVDEQPRPWVVGDDRDRDRERGSEEADGPEDRAEDESGMKRLELHASPMRYPRPRTVAIASAPSFFPTAR